MTQNMIQKLREISLEKMKISIVDFLEYKTLHREISWKKMGDSFYFHASYLGFTFSYSGSNYLVVKNGNIYLEIHPSTIRNTEELNKSLNNLMVAIQTIMATDFINEMNDSGDDDYFWGHKF